MTEIKYNGSVVANFEGGNTATLPVKDKKMKSDIIITVPEMSESLDTELAEQEALIAELKETLGRKGAGTNGLPIEIDSLDNSLLVAENDGKVYKCDDRLYQVHKITSLKGLTIKFNEHITPCPVIGEDDVFECSGTMVDFNSFPYGENRAITELSRKAIANSWATSGATSIVITVGYNEEKEGEYDTYYSPNTDNAEGAGWYQLDYYAGNEGKMYVHSPAITDFDCPALNENPEFIEWIMANAKVYSKIECVNDIQNLKFEQPYIGSLDLFSATLEIYDLYLENLRISGQYIASFSVNGEAITKTFSNFFTKHFPRTGEPDEVVAYFSDGNDYLSFCFSGTNESTGFYIYQLKYNGVVLDDGVSFTTFDCGDFNTSYYMLSFILNYTSIGYAALQEFITPEGTLEITANGKIDVKGYEKVDVNVIEINKEKEIEILGGEY